MEKKKYIITPSRDMIRRAEGRKGWKPEEKHPSRKKIFGAVYNSERTMALLGSIPELPSAQYVGKVTIKTHKLSKENIYYFFRGDGCGYYGHYLKAATIILKKKRVDVWFTGDGKERNVLILGTEEGAIGIAPILINWGTNTSSEKRRSLKPFLKGASQAFWRRIIFSAICRNGNEKKE